jgi:hypothetical protein
VKSSSRNRTGGASALLLAFLISICAGGYLSAQVSGADNDGARLDSELQRDWSVVILPPAAGDGDALRTAPLVRSLPSVIREALGDIRVRHLSAAELEVFRRSLEPLGADAETPLPAVRTLSISAAERDSDPLTALYHRQLRAYLDNGEAFHAETLARLAARHNADLFIGANIGVQDQYVFIELLIISPADALTGGDGAVYRELFSIRSIEALGGVEAFIAGDLGGALFGGEYGSVRVGWENGESYRVYLDGEYRGGEPMDLPVVGAGDHVLEIYRDTDAVFSRVIRVEAGGDFEVFYDPPQTAGDYLMLSTIPQGLAIYGRSSFLGFTPLKIPRPDTEEYLQLSGEAVGDGYIRIDPDSPVFLRYEIPHGRLDWRAQMTRDRRDFYRSLGFTLVSAIVPLVADGVNRNLSAAPTAGLTAAEANRRILGIKISRILSAGGLWITLISLADTVDQLLVYLQTAETARGVLPAPR